MNDHPVSFAQADTAARDIRKLAEDSLALLGSDTEWSGDWPDDSPIVQSYRRTADLAGVVLSYLADLNPYPEASPADPVSPITSGHRRGELAGQLRTMAADCDRARADVLREAALTLDLDAVAVGEDTPSGPLLRPDEVVGVARLAALVEAAYDDADAARRVVAAADRLHAAMCALVHDPLPTPAIGHLIACAVTCAVTLGVNLDDVR